ncbi:MAG: DUF5667 domain-containing protein [Candidatus Aenigmatarchaeota archaeon]
MKKLFVMFVFGVLAISMAPMVFAQSSETGNATGETIIGENAGTLPDSPLYGLKKFGEGIQSFFTFDQIEKAKLKYRLAQLRLMEADAMARINKTQLAENMMKEYENGLADVEADENTISAAGRNVSSIADLVGNNTYRHILVLQKVYEKVPDSAKPAIKKVLENSMNRQEKIAERIAGNSTVNITITVGNETVTREVPAAFAEKFLEMAKDMREKIKDEVELKDVEELKEKLAEKMEMGAEKVKEQISEVKEKLAEIESRNITEVSRPALDSILANAKTHLNNAESALEQKKYREAYSHAITAEKALYVAKELYKNRENIEKMIAEKMEIGKTKAGEQIESARNQISETGQKLASVNASHPAADKLLNQAKEHLNKAEQAFNNTKYGEAFGQAVAAEQAAKNAEKLAAAREKVAEKKTEIKKNVRETAATKAEAIKESVSGSAAASGASALE